MIVGQRLLLRTIFREFPDGDHHPVIVADCPKAVVEKPMSVLGEGKTILWVVIARAGELVDMSGVNDTACRNGRQAIACERTGVVVGRRRC